MTRILVWLIVWLIQMLAKRGRETGIGVTIRTKLVDAFIKMAVHAKTTKNTADNDALGIAADVLKSIRLQTALLEAT